MASPQAWPPYAALGTDCSLGFCSVYCPQWCFFYFPPPPPPPPRSTFALSPLLIAIIAVVTSAFLVVTSYLIALKCRNRRRPRPPASLSSAAPSSWLPPSSAGLDASLIDKLAVYRYRRGDGPTVNGDTDCSVCLAEFRDGDCLRLLPKCSHAFHRSCIDTWLGSHSNCPLCRAGVIGPVVELAMEEISEGEEEEEGAAIREEGRDDVVIEIREEGYEVRMAGESSAGDAPATVKRPLSASLGNSGS